MNQADLSPRLTLVLLLWMLALGLGKPVRASGDIDFMQLHRLAEYAAAAYRPESNIQALAATENMALRLHETLAENQVSFFVADSRLDGVSIVAIRGTSNVENALLDLSLQLQPDRKSGLRLHQGFAAAARQVYRRLTTVLEPGHRLILTGHSMGGAVAMILARYLDADGIAVDRVVTFGQPKVTNLPGADALANLDIVRVVTPLDLVPLLPLLDPLDLRNIDIYWHAGREVILLAEGDYALLEGTGSMLRATRFTRRLLNEENLRDHQMTLYLDLLAAKLLAAKRVPYPVDLNLFNLFGGQSQETLAGSSRKMTGFAFSADLLLIFRAPRIQRGRIGQRM